MTTRLQLPALFYGRYRDVKREMSRVVTVFRRERDWVAAIEAGGFLDVATTPGHILLEGPNQALGNEDHFHAFVFWRLLMTRQDNLPAWTRERVFKQSLTTVWGTLALIGDSWPTLLFPRERHIPFLRAAVTCWDELVSVGPRYSSGTLHTDHLWRVPNGVKYALVHCGAPKDRVAAPLPPGGLLALIQQCGIDLTQPDGNDATSK